MQRWLGDERRGEPGHVESGVVGELVDVLVADRHPGSDIFLDDVTVSRRHAEFYRHGTGFVVRDVGSLNGTYVNRERIEETDLNDGDEVQVGKFRLTFLGARRSQEDRGGGAQVGA